MPTCDFTAPQPNGFTYVGVLVAVALLGVGLSVTATVWSKSAERQRRAEADWVLKQYERALRSYYNASPGSVKTLPANLDELLADPRHLGMVRHLRKNYATHCGDDTTGKIRYQIHFPAVNLLIACPSEGRAIAERTINLE